jgi:RNA polymerase sigma-70 factor, ECF subfamily
MTIKSQMSEPAGLLSAAELFVLHATFVATFVRRLGAGAADVDDLVQETFLVAHRLGGFLPGEAKATTWLAAISLRLFRNHRRSLGRRPTTELSRDPMDQNSAVGHLEARSGLKRVQTALMQMDADHRAVFVLYELQEQACEDIAQALEIPVGTVYSRLHKARRKFFAAYEQLSPTMCPPTTQPAGRAL